MIIDIPTPDEFRVASLSQLHLAWQIITSALKEYDEALHFKLEDETPEEAAEEYWRRSQPALANAFTLIQLGMELALKGRIATVSPFLLTGDPRDWRGSGDHEDVSFSSFRTLDAADLVRVHNFVITPRLDDQFKTFWELVRRDRNKIMHTSSSSTFTPAVVVRTILQAIHCLHPQTRWTNHLLNAEAGGKFAALGVVGGEHYSVMQQIDYSLRHLEPAEALTYFGFDTRSRAYLCPHCYSVAQDGWQDEWPKLAQLRPRAPGSTSLYCLLCEQTTAVDRLACEDVDCPADVVAEGMCLTCMSNHSS